MISQHTSNFAKAFLSYGEAFRFIKKHRLTYYYLFPIAFTFLIIATGWHGTSLITSYILQLMSSNISWEFMGSGFLQETLRVLIWITFRIFFFLIISYLGGYIILIMMSPVFSSISVKTISILTGRKHKDTLQSIVNSAARGVILAVRNLLIEISLTIVLLIGSFIPIIGTLAPPLTIGVTAYYYGFSFTDYAIEQYNYNLKDSIRLMRRNRIIVLGVGLPFTLVLSIPFIGTFLSVFISLQATVAAAITAHRSMLTAK